MEVEYVYFRTKKDIQDKQCPPFDDPYSVLTSESYREQCLLANPFLVEDDEIVQGIGIVNNSIGGRVYYFPLYFIYNKALFRSATGSLLEVYPEYRKYATLGIDLTANVYNKKARMFIAGGMTPMAYKIHKFFGATEFVLPRYLLLQKSQAFIKGKLHIHKFPLRIYSAVGNLLLFIQSSYISFLRRWKTNKFNVQEIRIVPQEIEDIFMADSHKYKEYHSKDWFQWSLDYKFKNESKLQKNLYLIKDKNNKAIGFFMTKTQFCNTMKQYKNITLGSIVEWGTADSSVLSESQIMLIATKYFDSEVDAITCCTENTTLANCFRRMGMVKVGKENMVINLVSKKDKSFFEGYQDISNWRIRPAVGDTIMY